MSGALFSALVTSAARVKIMCFKDSALFTAANASEAQDCEVQ